MEFLDLDVFGWRFQGFGFFFGGSLYCAVRLLSEVLLRHKDQKQSLVDDIFGSCCTGPEVLGFELFCGRFSVLAVGLLSEVRLTDKDPGQG